MTLSNFFRSKINDSNSAISSIALHGFITTDVVECFFFFGIFGGLATYLLFHIIISRYFFDSVVACGRSNTVVCRGVCGGGIVVLIISQTTVCGNHTEHGQDTLRSVAARPCVLPPLVHTFTCVINIFTYFTDSNNNNDDDSDNSVLVCVCVYDPIV